MMHDFAEVVLKGKRDRVDVQESMISFFTQNSSSFLYYWLNVRNVVDCCWLCSLNSEEKASPKQSCPTKLIHSKTYLSLNKPLLFHISSPDCWPSVRRRTKNPQSPSSFPSTTITSSSPDSLKLWPMTRFEKRLSFLMPLWQRQRWRRQKSSCSINVLSSLADDPVADRTTLLSEMLSNKFGLVSILVRTGRWAHPDLNMFSSAKLRTVRCQDFITGYFSVRRKLTANSTIGVGLEPWWI